MVQLAFLQGFICMTIRVICLLKKFEKGIKIFPVCIFGAKFPVTLLKQSFKNLFTKQIFVPIVRNLNNE